MKVLMVEPGKSPYETEIEGGLESLQAAVGGDIQATYPFDDLVGLICNDEGKLIGLPLNRALYDDEGHLRYCSRQFFDRRFGRRRFYRPSR